MKKTLILLNVILLTFIANFQVSAAPTDFDETNQKNTIVKGRVMDSNNEPMIGVSVRVKDGKGGTITDMDGNFSISLPDGKRTLEFSFIGFATKSVNVRNKTNINVVMEEDAKLLDEVVVVGYGVQQKSHLSGSITKVDTEGMEDMPVSTLDQALLGKTAGVRIQNLTSEVGAESEITIRGTSSFSASSAPLIVVDGFPMDDGLDAINPNDVASIEILKDAASAAIYGSRAANGVIMITTKQGTANKPRYTLKVKYGIKDAYKLHDMMTATEFVERRVDELNLIGGTLGSGEIAQYLLGQYFNTDWQNEAFQNASYKNIDFSVSGGAKGLKYYVSGSYTGDEGLIKKNYYNRYNLRARIDADLSKRVSVGINIAPSYTKSERPGTDYMGFLRSPSWLPARHNQYTAILTGREEGEFAKGAHFTGLEYTGLNPQTGEIVTVTATPWNSSNNNPLGTLENTFQPTEQYRVQLQGYIDIKIAKGLKFRTANSYNFNLKESLVYRNEGARNDSDPNRAQWSSNKTVRMSSENTLNYNLKIGKTHNLTALLGASVYLNTTDKAGMLGFEFPTDQIHTLAGAGRIDQYESSSLRTATWKSDDSMASFFGRVNYALLDRYLISGSLRADGSSKFGENNRWAWFPSISGAWRISEEPFLKGKANWLSQLKLRASYGVTGTNSISNYANMELLSSAPYVLGTGNGSTVLGLANNSSTLGNESLRWEQTASSNFGIDISLFNNRISLALDYYYSTTKSLLYEKTVNSIAGYVKAWTNEGKLRNRGFELELNTRNVKTRKFTWDTSFNLSLNRNRLLSLEGPAEQITQGNYNNYFIARVGDPLIQYFGYKVIGVWKSQEEIDNNPHYITDRPGGLRVQDTNNDGVVNDDDRVPLGNPYPDFTWGMTNKFKYRDFDLSFVIQGQVGGKVLNADPNYTELRDRDKAYTGDFGDRWLSEEHPGDGKTPYRDYGIYWYLTDYMIEDAGYLALRDVTLGYTLPKKFARKIGLQGLRIYATGQNLLYLMAKDYRGINPEARSGSKDAMMKNASQRGSYPIVKSYNFGININF